MSRKRTRFYNARIGRHFRGDVVSFQVDTLGHLSTRLHLFGEHGGDQLSLAPSCWEIV